MSDSHDVELVSRPLIRSLAIGAAVFGAVTTPAVWLDGGRFQIPLTAAVFVFFLALPLWALWLVHDRRYIVRSDRLTVTRRGRTVREFPYAELIEVRPAFEGSAGAATPEFWNKTIFLIGRTPQGKRRGVKVSSQLVESIDPLLVALAPEIARRPELLSRDVYRANFAEYVADLERGGPQRG